MQKWEKKAEEDKERYKREMKDYQAKGGSAVATTSKASKTTKSPSKSKSSPSKTAKSKEFVSDSDDSSEDDKPLKKKKADSDEEEEEEEEEEEVRPLYFTFSLLIERDRIIWLHFFCLTCLIRYRPDQTSSIVIREFYIRFRHLHNETVSERVMNDCEKPRL